MASAVEDRPAFGSGLRAVGASDAIIGLLDGVRPSVVQLRAHGRGIGAGVVWDADGGIVTNAHVVAGDPQIEVIFTDGRCVAAHVIRACQELDLALLQVPAGGLMPATLGDSARLRVGELVFAIGHPWGQREVMTAGIISGFGDRHIKSDVSLAPGNSGGPLIDASGRVIGINSMIFGGDLAVSIPIDAVRAWVG